MPAVSLASAIVASAVPADGEVLVASGEFRSVLYPFLVAETRRLLRVREVSPDGLLNALSERTALVALSHVRSADGHVADLDAVVRRAHAAGALVYVDATHSVGTLPFDAKRSGVDFMSCAGYKWLCCPRGVAFLWCRRELQQRMSPVAAGWRASVDHRIGGYYGGPLDLAEGAARFDVSLAWHAWVGAAESLKAITMIDEEERFHRGYQLARTLANDLELPEPRSAIVSVPVASRESARARLKEAKVKVTEQRDRVRVSPHFYNTEKDIERAVIALSTLVAR